jgi:apoptotic chromatin condensation inducer in the nucleus
MCCFAWSHFILPATIVNAGNPVAAPVPVPDANTSPDGEPHNGCTTPGICEGEDRKAILDQEERRLREKVMQSMKKTAPRETEVDSGSQSTCNVRIDNFQRPFTVRSLKEWIEEKAGVSIDESGLWLNAIKTHCYVSFRDAADAAKCREAVHGERYPSSNSSTLVATFVDMSAVEASSAPEAALRLLEWRQRGQQVESAPAARLAADATASGSSLGKRKLVTPSGGGMFGVMRNALAAAAEGGAAAKSPRLAQPPLCRTGSAASATTDATEIGSVDGGFTTKRAGRGDVKTEDIADAEEVSADNALDALFRKTATRPQLYWLPVSDEQIERRKSKSSSIGI